MKVLHIVRHAQAASRKDHQTDFDRKLTEKGAKTARAVARRLRKAGFSADCMITSPAPRALETARVFAREMKYSLKKIDTQQVIYDGADNASLLAFVRELPAKDSDAFLFGHDPTFTKLANHLVPSLNQPLPKCAVVTIGFETDNWMDICADKARLLRFDYPVTKREREQRIEAEIQALAASLSSSMAKHLHGLDPRTADKLRRYVFKYHSTKKMRKIARRFADLAPKHDSKK